MNDCRKENLQMHISSVSNPYRIVEYDKSFPFILMNKKNTFRILKKLYFSQFLAVIMVLNFRLIRTGLKTIGFFVYCFKIIFDFSNKCAMVLQQFANKMNTFTIWNSVLYTFVLIFSLFLRFIWMSPQNI